MLEGGVRPDVVKMKVRTPGGYYTLRGGFIDSRFRVEIVPYFCEAVSAVEILVDE